MAISVIEIQGTWEQIQAVRHLAGLHLAGGSVTQLDADTWRIEGDATAAGIAAAQALGTTVIVHMDEAETLAHLNAAFDGIDENPIV